MLAAAPSGIITASTRLLPRAVSHAAVANTYSARHRTLTTATAAGSFRARIRTPAVTAAFAMASSAPKYSTLATPDYCYVDFCLVPLGTGSVSVAEEVAECQKVLQESGLSYTLHSAGTTVEGPWDQVMKAIGQAHSAVLAKGVVRIQTSMRVGTRTDRKQVGPEKIKRVEDILARDGK